MKSLTTLFIAALVLSIFTSCGSDSTADQYAYENHENYENFDNGQFANNGQLAHQQQPNPQLNHRPSQQNQPAYQQNNGGYNAQFGQNPSNNQGHNRNQQQYNQQYNQEYKPEQNQYQPRNSGGPTGQMQANQNSQVIMHPLYNVSTNELMGQLPMPANWKINGSKISGPNGISIEEHIVGTFDQNQKRRNTIEEVIQKDLAPLIQQQGGKIVRTYSIPEMAESDYKQSQLYWSYAPKQTSCAVTGIEVLDPQGVKGLAIVRFQECKSQFANFWSLGYLTLDADPSALDQAAKDLIYAQVNYQTDMQYLQKFNNQMKQKANQSDQAFQTRMRNMPKPMASSVQTTNDIYNSISDSNMDSWKRRNAISDAGHSNVINAITGHENAYNPTSGQTMQVETGYDRYFENGNGEYFGTNDHNYEPYGDMNLNGNWTEMEGNW